MGEYEAELAYNSGLIDIEILRLTMYMVHLLN